MANNKNFVVKNGIEIRGSGIADAVSTTTGALVVSGGVGITGSLYAGNIYTNGQLVGAVSNTTTNLAGGVAGAIAIQTGAGQTSFIAPGTSGQLLQMGTNTATWISTSTLNVGQSVLASSAVKLQTARTITATGDASWVVTFDGTVNTSSVLTLANTGVVAGTYTKVTVDAKGRITTGTTLLASDIPTLNQNTTGNAGTATKLQTARTIAATGDGSWIVTFDGSANTSSVFTLANSGVTAGTYGSALTVPAFQVNAKGLITTVTNTQIQLASTTQLGVVQLNATTSSTSNTQAATAGAVKTAYDLAAAAIPSSLLGAASGVATLDASGLVPASQLPSYVDDVLEYPTLSAFPAIGETSKIYVALDTNLIYRWSGSIYVSISAGSGTVDSALKLTTARNITAIGDANWSVSFDGSADVTATITLVDTGVISGTYTKFTVDSKGRITTATNLLASDIPTLNQDTTGNAATATKLQTARTINGVSFDGSANITISSTTTNALTIGAWLTGGSFNGSSPTTVAVDGTSTNTANKVVVRDASGGFSAGTVATTGITVDGSLLFDYATLTTTSTATNTLAQFATATYGSGEFTIQATQGTSRHLTKLMVLHDGTTAIATEYGTLQTSISLYSVEVDISAGNVRVLISPTSATSTVFKASYRLVGA